MRLWSIFRPLQGQVFSGTENILRHSKYNLPFAGANKIPLSRNWLQALLTAGNLPLIFVVSSGIVFMPVLCIIKFAFRNPGAKLRHLSGLICSLL
jgi:hypothetical protein